MSMLFATLRRHLEPAYMKASRDILNRIGLAGSLLAMVAGCAAPKPAALPAVLPFEDPDSSTVAEAEAALPPPPPEGYDWDLLARRAAACSGEAKALWLEAVAERGQIAVDTAWRDPQLRLGSRTGSLDENTYGPGSAVTAAATPYAWENHDSDAYEAGARINIVNPFVNRWLRQRGESAARAKEAAAQEASYAAYCEVRSLCLEAASLRTEIDVLAEMAHCRKDARDLRTQQAAAGQASALDVIHAVTDFATLRADLREKISEYRALVRRISMLADVPVSQIHLRAPAAVSPLPGSVPPTDGLVDLAFARRPDLARVKHEKDAAKAGLGAAKADLIPWFDYVEGGYSSEDTHINAYERDSAGYDQADRDATEWQINLAINVPIFGWDGKEVRVARTRTTAAETRLRARLADTRAEVAGVRADYLRACADRDRIVAEARQVQQVMEAKNDEMGQAASVNPADLLAAREEVAAYRLVALKAERDCLRLEQQLESLAGGPLAP